MLDNYAKTLFEVWKSQVEQQTGVSYSTWETLNKHDKTAWESVAAFIAKPSVGFIIIGTTGCSCCRNENFVDGLFDTIEQAKSKAQNHTERRTVRSQYSDTGIYEIRRIEYLQLPDERVVIGSRVFDDRYFFETGEDISWSMQYEGTAAA